MNELIENDKLKPIQSSMLNIPKVSKYKQYGIRYYIIKIIYMVLSILVIFGNLFGHVSIDTYLSILVRYSILLIRFQNYTVPTLASILKF